MSRFGTLVRRVDERGRGIDLPLMSVSQFYGVIRRSELTDDPPRAESLDDYKICRAGDIVFNKMSIRDGAMGVAQEDGLVTYHYEVMRPLPGADARYVAYLMKSQWFKGELIKRERGIGAGGANGVRTTEVPFRVLRMIDAYAPSARTQTAIAGFLDRELAQIDAMIEAQRELVERLAEHLDAVITDAVSGPSLAQLRREWIVLDCLHHTAPEVEGTELFVASIGQLAGRSIDLATARTTSEDSFRLMRPGGRNPEPGDLVMSRNASVGAAALVTQDTGAFALGQDVVLLKPRGSACGRYLQYALRSALGSQQLTLAMVGSTFKRVNVSQIDALRFHFPSSMEQNRIADELDMKCAQVEAMIAEANDSISLMLERRSALITAAVTGCIDPDTGRETTPDLQEL